MELQSAETSFGIGQNGQGRLRGSVYLVTKQRRIITTMEGNFVETLGLFH